ncbi:MAG: mobilization protein [Candidatus Competibacteraceae bacterium]|nr:mobilization protein [Candidatus Competibacteraceae bacterium]
MSGIDDRIADLEKRLKQAKALKQQQLARERAAEKKRQRSDDTRRKILVGAVILAKVEHGEWPKERLREWMDKALTRADDRALFGLLPVPSEPETRLRNTAPD